MSKIPLSPRAGWVVGQYLEAEAKTDSGIYIPGGTNKENVAKVLRVGKDISDIKVRDLVIFRACESIEINDQKYLLIQEDQILAVKEEE